MKNYIALAARPLFLFLIGFLFLGGVAFLNIRATEELDRLRGLREDTELTLQTTHHFLEIGIDIETSQRGYLLTGQEKFLEPFQSGSRKVQDTVDELTLHLEDRPGLRSIGDQLSRLLTEKQSFSAETIRIAKEGNLKRARAMVAGGHGKSLMDEIRKLTAEIDQNVKAELAEREESANRELRQVQSFSGLTILSAFIALGLALVFNNRDIRRRVQLEAELQNARKKAEEASQQKSTFLAHMSHEIRTPLNGIIGSIDLLQQTSLDQQQARHAQVVRESSLLLLGLINNLLDLSKIEAGKLVIEKTFLDLRKVLNDSVNTVRYSAVRKGVGIEVSVDPEVPACVQGDPLRMQQILMNLLSNAVKFTRQGKVTLQLTCARQGKSRVDIRGIVADEGIGMSPEILSSLFTSFQQGDQSTTRKYGGTGLGLAITRQLVEAMGGEIQARSEVGVGTRFEFELPFEPLAAASVEGPEKLSQLVDPHFSPLRILVAEDNLINQEVISGMLKRLGHSVDIAPNGQLALERLKAHPYDIVLMDCHMPEMDGYTATHQIRERGTPGSEHLPIIAVTANAGQSDLIDALASGMDDYLSKPIVMQDLKHKLNLWSPRRKEAHENIIDQETLEGFLSTRDPRSAGEYFQKQREELTRFLDQLATLSTDGRADDLPLFIETAALLKNSFSVLGLPRIKTLLDRLEHLLRNRTSGQEEVGPIRVAGLQLKSELRLGERHLSLTRFKEYSGGAAS